MDHQVPEPPHRVPALDLLRLVAVLGVATFHYGFRGPEAFNVSQVALPDIGWFARYGFLGVPAFFIISGFVIAYSAQGRSAATFAVARISRIYPTFLICMTLTCCGLVAFGHPHFETSVVQWWANFIIAAPLLHQPYMDSAYWSLVIEVTFYAWIAVFISTGIFPRRIDAIVVVWLAISMLNELTFDARIVERIFLADGSGYFATGLLIYEMYRGRRDALLQCLLALATATAIFQAVHDLRWLRDESQANFDDWIVAAICLWSILAITFATRIRRLPIPSRILLAIGGTTYSLYLLHQQLGYAIVERIGPVEHPSLLVGAVLSGIAILSWAIWRFFERPAQRLIKKAFTQPRTAMNAAQKV
jgi:peptidoglycan/LPS O-acetylase OafA/YrhL